MIKAVFFDIDGTLVSWKTGTYPPSIRYVLRVLRQKKIICIVATGRSKYELTADCALKGLRFDAYLLNNGQEALDASGRCFYSLPLNTADMTCFMNWADQTGCPAWAIGRDTCRLNRCTAGVEQILRSIHTGCPPVGPLVGMESQPIYRVSVFAPPSQVPLELIPHCRQVQWHPEGHDLLPAEGGKSQAIAAALQHFHILPEESMAFGDSDNDCEMLRLAGIGVAMGAATGQAKAAADYITTDCDEDGILQALLHFGVLSSPDSL